MENPDFTDEEDQVYDNVEQQQDAIREYSEESAEDISPNPTDSENLYSLLHHVIEKKDSTKIANLDKYELGMLDMSVRDCQKIAGLCNTLGYKKVADWLRNNAEIVLATSSSKKGFLLELFVTAKRFSSKEKRLGVPEGIVQTSEKKGFWSRFKK